MVGCAQGLLKWIYLLHAYPLNPVRNSPSPRQTRLFYCRHYSFGSSNKRRADAEATDAAAAALPEGCEGELPGGLWGLVARPGVSNMFMPDIRAWRSAGLGASRARRTPHSAS